MIRKFLNLFVEDVHAHCDIPCGIYDPKTAQIAAATVLKMVQKIEELSQTDEYKKCSVEGMNSMSRMVMVKEEHARKCKEEILILWTDYFKPEDLSRHPDLHEVFWMTAKLISKNKQEVNIDAANELVAAVKKIADMFAQTVAARAK